ncbi:MAG: hypothetical protein WC373_13640 [Smithella sp.]|jgi:hypothetical protein
MATCKRCGQKVEKEYDVGCFYYFCDCGACGRDIQLTETETLRNAQEREESEDEY